MSEGPRGLGRVQSDGGLLRKDGLMRRSSSANFLAALNKAQDVASLHQQSKWEEHGGWRPNSLERREEHKMERDASMVSLLNLIDPDSLVDRPSSSPSKPTHSESLSSQIDSSFDLQHSALSRRGVALVGGMSAIAWYVLRLVLRDVFRSRPSRERGVLELHALSSIHALGWLLFLLQKLRSSAQELPRNCSRALVASLGFYIHDCWALRGTLLQNPAMLMHQSSVAVTIASILRSKGVAWLAPALMSLSIPTLVQELLQLCGTMGLPATRPEVRGLRLLWFVSFAASKISLVPLWLRHYQSPEMHQPNLLAGKRSYVLGLLLNLHFMFSAARDLPRFLRPEGALVPVSAAYRKPLQGAQAAATGLTAGLCLAVIFGSYLTAPVAAALTMFAFLRRGSSAKLRIAALLGCSLVAADQALPMSKECSLAASSNWMMPVLRAFNGAFRHRFYPQKDVKDFFRNDQHYLLAVTPHGFFPWGVSAIICDLLQQGYFPNFVGASVLGALPVAGRILRFFGYQPATPEAISRCLKMKYPRNVTIIVPGGISEMFKIRDDLEISAANIRTGFVKLAAEHGAMLVPGYMLGNSQLYQVARGLLGQVFEQLSRRLRTSVNLFHGRWGTLLPYPHKLATALGEPIDTSQIKGIEEAHKLWMEGLRRTFDLHKADFGWKDRQLFFDGEDIPDPPEDPLEAYTSLPMLSKL